MSATEAQIETLRTVTAKGNSITYSAQPSPGETSDVWKNKPDRGTWECRDYTQYNADQLTALGWPKEDLLIVLLDDELGEFHAVLNAITGGDDWIIDNRWEEPYLRSQCPYAYVAVERQIPNSTEFEPLPPDWFSGPSVS